MDGVSMPHVAHIFEVAYKGLKIFYISDVIAYRHLNAQLASINLGAFYVAYQIKSPL